MRMAVYVLLQRRAFAATAACGELVGQVVEQDKAFGAVIRHRGSPCFPSDLSLILIRFSSPSQAWLIRLLLRLLQQRRYVGPQLGERLLFVRREFGQRRCVADAGQVAVLLPAIQGLYDEQSSLGRAGSEELVPPRQLGLHPVPRLPRELPLR